MTYCTYHTNVNCQILSLFCIFFPVVLITYKRTHKSTTKNTIFGLRRSWNAPIHQINALENLTPKQCFLYHVWIRECNIELFYRKCIWLLLFETVPFEFTKKKKEKKSWGYFHPMPSERNVFCKLFCSWLKLNFAFFIRKFSKFSTFFLLSLRSQIYKVR